MNIFTPNTKIRSSLVNENFNGLADGSFDIDKNSMEMMRRMALSNFVSSGFTIPTSVNLTATIATGFAIVNGKYVTRTAISKTFTASKDTYVDLLDDGTIVYIAVANNATTGMALSLNTDGSKGLRLARVVTSATAITLVNQIPDSPVGTFAGFDVLGNRIYNTMPSPRLLGLNQIANGTTQFSLSNPTALQIPQMPSLSFIADGRKQVEVELFVPDIYWGTGGYLDLAVYDATMSRWVAGTSIALSVASANSDRPFIAKGQYTPTAGLHLLQPYARQGDNTATTYNLSTNREGNYQPMYLKAQIAD